jgi:hypothetical protein
VVHRVKKEKNKNNGSRSTEMSFTQVQPINKTNQMRTLEEGANKSWE